MDVARQLRHQGCVVSSTNGFVTFDETKVNIAYIHKISI